MVELPRIFHEPLEFMKRPKVTPDDPGWKILNGFRWRVLVFVVLLHVLAGLLFLTHTDIPEKAEDWILQFVVLLVISQVLAGFVLSRRHNRASDIMLGVQAFVLIVAAYPEGNDLGLISLMAAIIVTELSLWLARGVTVVTAAALLMAGAMVSHPLKVWDRMIPLPGLLELAILLLAILLFELVCFSFRHYVISTGLQSQEIGELNESLGNLLNANLDFQNYAVESGERSTVEERKRLTREIHDVVGYTMINLKMMLEAATDLVDPDNERLASLLDQAKTEVANGLTETRQALRIFRDLDRQKIEGIPYFHKITSSFSRATGITVEVNYGNIPWSFGEDLNALIYRIIQESMTNAFRHGHATHIHISFWINAGRLIISVDDNGSGGGDMTPGIGFTGMRERLEPLKGQLFLSREEQGFSLRAEIPWPGD